VLTAPLGYLKKIATTAYPNPSLLQCGAAVFCIENHNNNGIFHPNISGSV